jgi:hypothetical protein
MWIKIILALLLCYASVGPVWAAFPTGWGRKCELQIQASKVDANQTNFVVLIDEDIVPAEAFAGGAYPALDGGGDVRFSSNSDGSTQISCEITAWDSTNSTCQVWVKVPSVSSSSNTSIWIWYKKSGESQPAEDAAFGSESVWSSSYFSVWHLEEDPSGTPPEMLDETSNDYDGTMGGTMLTEDLVAAQIGNGLDFEGNDDNINFNYAAFDDVPTSYDFCIAVWGWQSAEADGLAIWGWGGTDDLIMYPYDDFGGDGVRIFWRDLGGNIIDENSSTRAGAWHQIVFQSSASNKQILFVDGVRTDSSTATGTVGPFDDFWLSGREGAQFYNGIIDESRITTTAKDGDWILAQYNAQSDPATFILEQTPETPGAPAATAAQVIIIGGK